jgi:hypothetical protein
VSDAPEPTDGPTGTAEDRIARSRTRRALADADEAVPRIPRGKGFRVSRGQWIKIVLTGGLLVMLLLIQKPCASSVSSFVTSFDDPGSASSKMPKPGTVDGSGSGGVLIRGDMSEAEMKAALERAGLHTGSGSARGSADLRGSGSAEKTNGAGSGSAGAGRGSGQGR